MTAATMMSRVRQASNGAAGALGCTRSTVVIRAVLPIGVPPGTNDAVLRLGERRDSSWACFLRRYEPDQVPRVCGLATLSARVRSPEAVFSCDRWYLRLAQLPIGEARGTRRWLTLSRTQLTMSPISCAATGSLCSSWRVPG